MRKESTEDGVRLRFRTGADDELQTLVTLERECCSFAEWSLRGDGREVVLEVTATGEGIAAVHALFDDA